MSLFNKQLDKSVDDTEKSEAEELVKKAVPNLPQDLTQALEAIEQEWEIFQTRVETLFRNYADGASNNTVKKSMRHAKHASMCIRDALKAFGRLSL